MDYPIALITADEAAYDGGVYGTANTNKTYYLWTGIYYHTMTPYSFNPSLASAIILDVAHNGYLYSVSSGGVSQTRPVINLKLDIEIMKGTDTGTEPYIIKTN